MEKLTWSSDTELSQQEIDDFFDNDWDSECSWSEGDGRSQSHYEIMIDKKGKKIYFSSSREDAFGKERDPITGQKYMDIFVAEYDDKMNPINVKSIDTKGIINTAENEGSV
jgi:hypothetical protein